LRVALDSSPLWGAGKVEDTYTLLGHALRKALGVLARQQGRGLAERAAEAGAPVVGGPMSLKARLDLDWDDVGARRQGLRVALQALEAREAREALEALEPWRAGQPEGAADGPASRAAAAQVRAQDVALAARGEPTLRRGVSRERRIRASYPSVVSVCRMSRGATGARVGGCAWRGRSGTCCTIWRAG
jgi:hypothetical protein